jgi:indolepyruvate ferredoxin oxidoreductase alpha subunit
MLKSSSDRPGLAMVLGNEIVARALVEAGARFVAGHPGSPSSEIVDELIRCGETHAEWAVNEAVALQMAAAASYSGARSAAVMKHNGVAVALDFLESLAYTGSRAGLLLVACDDPQGLMSGTRGDSRNYARLAKIPCIEPGFHADIDSAVAEGFQLSERVRLPVMLRLVTGLCHSHAPFARARARLEAGRPLRFDPETRILDFPPLVPALRHQLHTRTQEAESFCERSVLNRLEGPTDASVCVVGVGVGAAYAREALDRLGASAQRIRLLSLTTVWPLPRDRLASAARGASEVLVVEEAEPFLEPTLKALLADQPWAARPRVVGRESGHLPSVTSPDCGQLESSQVAAALEALLIGGAPPAAASSRASGPSDFGSSILPRAPALCAGCPHRSSLNAARAAVNLAGKGAFVVGDIGCYGLGAGAAGYDTINVLHNMGASIGVGLGFAQLGALGFDQSVLVLIGDGTFLHTGLPALAQAAAAKAPLIVAILDNGVTAMTGRQPNPATDQAIRIEEICRGLGLEVTVMDALDVKACTIALAGLLDQRRPAVAILRAPCIFICDRESAKPFRVDQDRCIGSDCGCDRFCARVLQCPANLFDEELDRAYIDTHSCTGCGLCADFCPTGAIVPALG